MNFGQFKYLIVLLFIFSEVLVSKNHNNPRYQILQNYLIWRWDYELPFNIIKEMCWNNVEGFCDEEFSQTDRHITILNLIDYQNQIHGVVRKVNNNCYVFWMQPEYGSDNQPHVGDNYWIECPVLNINWFLN